jgi:hypothetical protein
MPTGHRKRGKKSVLEVLDEIDDDELNIHGLSNTGEEHAVGKELDEDSVGSKDEYDEEVDEEVEVMGEEEEEDVVMLTPPRTGGKKRKRRSEGEYMLCFEHAYESNDW